MTQTKEQIQDRVNKVIRGNGKKKIYNLDKTDYVFSLEIMEGTTGLYEILGVVSEEEIVGNFLKTEETMNHVARVQVFTLGQIEGPVRIINSLEEFMEFQ